MHISLISQVRLSPCEICVYLRYDTRVPQTKTQNIWKETLFYEYTQKINQPRRKNL